MGLTDFAVIVSAIVVVGLVVAGIILIERRRQRDDPWSGLR